MPLVKDVAQRQAEAVLEQYWDGKLPVDPAKIALRLNMQVYRANLRDSQSGLIIKESGKTPSIYLNANEPSQRQNFTCAHELGHFFDRDAQADDEYSFVDYRDDTPNDAREWFAEHFAANLLMPTRAFIELFDRGLSTYDLAAHFGVSQPAVRSRARSLRLRHG